MIPDRIIEFFKGPMAISAASRDQQLQPYSARALGPIAVSEGENIAFYLPQRGSGKLLDSYSENKRVALVVCDITNFETYQFKGEFISARACGEEEYASINTYVAQIEEAIIQIGYPEDFVRKWVADIGYESSVLVAFRVEEVFHQTPGPGTGNAINE